MQQLVTFNGVTTPVLTLDKMGLAEVSAVEKVTGLNMPMIRRMSAGCVCSHDVQEHVRYDDDDNLTADTSCKICKRKCDSFEADIPTLIRTAFTWVSIKRVEPTVKFSDVADAVGDDAPTISYIDDDESDGSEADPTEADQPEESPS